MFEGVTEAEAIQLLVTGERERTLQQLQDISDWATPYMEEPTDD